MLQRVQAVLIGLLLIAVASVGWSQRRFVDDMAGQQNKVRDQLTSLKDTLLGVQQRLDLALPQPVMPAAYAPPFDPNQPVTALGPDGELIELSPPPNVTALKDEGDFTWVKLSAAGADLRGVVTNAAGKPVAEAKVLLILKTWPNNRFRQNDFALETDESGHFGIGGVIPFKGQYGINAAVVAEGHAIASKYVLVEETAGKSPEELRLELSPSKPLRIVVTDDKGKPLVRAVVAPSGRVTEDDKEILVYHQGSQPAWRKTDEEGAVTVDWFVPGDLAKISIRPRGGDWQEHKFEVTDAQEVTVTIKD